jgi:ribokinase
VEQVVDTTGAGGCFIAGFLHGMIQWGNIPRAIKIANMTAGRSKGEKKWNFKSST